MAPRAKAPKPRRDWKANLAIHDVARKVTRAQSLGVEIVLVLRTRPVRKLRGVIEGRRIDERRKLSGRDGESNLIVTVAGEDVPLEKIAEVRRPAPR